jgi:ParB family transcriptional regulator, chromosome partitioning protein
VSKERRLGRGLEALLGQIPARSEPAAPGQQADATEKPAASNAPAANPSAPSPSAPSPESLFRLDMQHGLTGFSSPPHQPPSQLFGPTAVLNTPPTPPVSLPTLGPDRINVHQIDSNPAQPRQDFDEDEMRALSESLSTHGLLQPLVVRRVRDRYQLVAGERRLRAAIEAGWNEVPVNVIEADDRQMAELAIIENLQRKDLNPLEKAASFQKYLDEYGCTQEELAGRLKLDRSTIANLIRLLELPEPVQKALRGGQITQGHARALLPLGDEREQTVFCQRIQREGLNVRQTEALVQETIDTADQEPLAAVETETKPESAKPARAKNDHIAALEQSFRSALGVKVKISHNARGRGKMVIQFRNHEEFERLKKQICGG